MQCEECKWFTKKLKGFMRWLGWCKLYKCQAEYKCIDWKGRSEKHS